MNRRRAPLRNVVVLVACAVLVLTVGQGLAYPPSLSSFQTLTLSPGARAPGPAMVASPLATSPSSNVVHLPSSLGSFVTPMGSCSVGRGGTCPHLQTQISVAPSEICETGATCPSGVPSTARVTLWANATGQQQLVYPPKVQVVFDVETTLFDGVYDPTAGDVGLSACNGPCSESNAVPFFVSNAGIIAKDITGDFPGSNVTFAMVDYFSTSNCAPGSGGCNPPCTTGTTIQGDNDDGDGCEYHVDISSFVDAVKFGKLVPPTFQNYTLSNGAGAGCNVVGWMYCDSDFSDNQLDSSSITSLYGTLRGSGLGLDPKADLVVIWMGSTVPRDPHYVDDYSVFDSDYSVKGTPDPTASCEPAFTYNAYLASPSCEGWVVPSSANNSIADLAAQKHVIINTIALDTGTTLQFGGDYLSPQTSTAARDVGNIINASCDLATATGGNWAGPVGYSCNGVNGYLTGGFIPAGQNANPPTAWSSNPLLGTALTSVKFPLTWTNRTAINTTGNAFQFIPAHGFSLTSAPAYSIVSCYRSPSQPPMPGPCSATPTHTGLTNGGVGWSWPDSTMYLSDSWGVSFNIQASATLNGSALGTPISVDACQAQLFASCGGPINGSISAAQYLPYTNAPPPVSASFPPGMVTVYDSGPVVDISASPASIDVKPTQPLPGTYTTTLTATILGGSGGNGYAWSHLPPGCLAADLPVISCTPTAVGTYQVQVAVTDSHGVTGSGQYTLVVHPDPVAPLTGSPQFGVPPLFTVFSANVTGGLPPYTYDLSFGDRFNDSPTLPAHHAYLGPGYYRISLTVTDAVGGEAVAFMTVVTVSPMQVGLKVLPDNNPYAQRSVSFNASITNGGLWPFYYSWTNLPPGCTGGNFEEIDCTPTATGLYQVTVHVADSAYENVSATTNLTLRALPVLVEVPLVGPVPEYRLVSDLVAVLVGCLVGLVIYFMLIALYRLNRERGGSGKGDDEEKGGSGGPPAAEGPAPVSPLPPATPPQEVAEAGPPPLDAGGSPLPAELPPAAPFVVPDAPASPASPPSPGGGAGGYSGSDDITGPPSSTPPLPSSDAGRASP